MCIGSNLTVVCGCGCGWWRTTEVEAEAGEGADKTDGADGADEADDADGADIVIAVDGILGAGFMDGIGAGGELTGVVCLLDKVFFFLSIVFDCSSAEGGCGGSAMHFSALLNLIHEVHGVCKSHLIFNNLHGPQAYERRWRFGLPEPLS